MGSVDRAETGGLSLLVRGDADEAMAAAGVVRYGHPRRWEGAGAALKVVLSAVVASVTMIGEAMMPAAPGGRVTAPGAAWGGWSAD